jgi:ribonuclease-3
MMSDPREASLAFAARSGLSFNDLSLLELALTHPSFVDGVSGGGYQRLEFLGDSVVGRIVADNLYRSHPDSPEGDLTRMKIEAVRSSALADAAERMDLGSALVMGGGAEDHRERPSVLEAAFEALAGAIYLDQGVEAARSFVTSHLGDLLQGEYPVDDPKTVLQEVMQARGLGQPVYRITGRSGPDHEPRFAAEVEVSGQVAGTGEGVSKQAAQKDAALHALEAFRAER